MLDNEHCREFKMIRNCGRENAIVPGKYYLTRNRKPHSRKVSRAYHQRSLTKNGEFNIDIPQQKCKLSCMSQWFISLVEAKWRWTLLHFFIAFTGDWLFFGFIYWIISVYHGDFDVDNMNHTNNTITKNPCITRIHSFTSTFLFSIEVHTTLAYGNRKITLECPPTIIAMCLQCILSSIFQALLVGILFAKITRPKCRTQTILFSKNAVISMRDQTMCLIFRVGDIRKSKILNIVAKAFLIQHNEDVEDEHHLEQETLDLELDGCESMFYLWPVSYIHIINETSPFYHMSAADILMKKFEVIALFEGVIESTGQIVQARTSYIDSEILWGHRFVPMVNDEKRVFDVDFSKISETTAVDTPLCSASELDLVLQGIVKN